MPHAVEMPSLLSDDNGPALSSTTSSFDLPFHLRQSHEKANGTPDCPSMNGSLQSGPEGYGDGLNGIKPGANDEMQPVRRLDSVTNGRPSGSSWERSSLNESTLSVHGTYGNGGVENGQRGPHLQHGMSKIVSDSRMSYSSIVGMAEPPQTPPTTMSSNGEHTPTVNSSSISRKRQISIPPPISINPQSTGPLTYTSSLLPASPGPDTLSPRTNPNSPHRFSSPPAVPSSANSLTASNPGQGIRHRHTLEVPKTSTSRSSRDSNDVVSASGRFSPTARRGSMGLVRRHTRSVTSDPPREEVPTDEDAARWAEAIRQKRVSKRKRNEDDDDDRVVVGTRIDQTHVNWVTAYNMLTGIRFTVSRCNAKLSRPLTDADFDAKHKHSFDISGNELTPSARYDFKFKDYAPWVFRHLRARFKLDPADYLMSLTSKCILSELGSPGKSGSFFYFSRDYKYIIKTIHHAEHKFLRKILKNYYTHVENNPNTLLSQFYGLHRVKMPYGRKIHFVVMNNLFPPHRDIHQTYDLKGSTVGRDFKEEDIEKNPRATLKDLNWLRKNKHLELGPEKRDPFVEQMERDVELLQKLKIMDYSMLVGIHDLQKGNEENLRDKTLQVFQPGVEFQSEEAQGHALQPPLSRSPSKLETARKARELREMIKQEKPVPMGQTAERVNMEESNIRRDFTFYIDDGGYQATHEDNRPGEEIYYLGIIDCLTHYGMRKKIENFFKGLSHDSSQISPIPPEGYGERFIKFITGITKTREQAERELAEAEAAMAAQEQADGEAERGEGHRGRPRSHSQPFARSSTDNSAMQRAEAQALKSELDGSRNDDRPDRTRTAVRSPSAERSNGVNGATLPVVEEVGESSSTGGRSTRTAEVDGNIHEREDRPPTPPKDDVGEPLTKMQTPPPTRAPPPPPGQELPIEVVGPSTPPPSRSPPPPPVYGTGDATIDEDGSSRTSTDSWKEKALPPVPRVSSPEVMNEREKSILQFEKSRLMEPDRGMLTT